MDQHTNYLKINKEAWNKRTDVHFDSDFYDNNSFLKGRNSLNSIELELLGDVKGKTILHLQCHFGQDTISLNRMGANSTGVDFSDQAIIKAKELTKMTGANCDFICCDIYDLPNHLEKEFDIVFTSYGTIGWLPDLDKWAEVVSRFLKKGGRFIMAEFHPVVWMFDDDFKEIKYPYLNRQVIQETESGTYTDRNADLNQEYVSWNHGISEVLNALIGKGLSINTFNEFDYSPYNCFKGTQEISPGRFQIKKLGEKIPMVYSIMASKQ